MLCELYPDAWPDINLTSVVCIGGYHANCSRYTQTKYSFVFTMFKTTFSIHTSHTYTCLILTYMAWLWTDIHYLSQNRQPSWIMQIRFPVHLRKLFQCILQVQKPIFRHFNHHDACIITIVMVLYRFYPIYMQIRSSWPSLTHPILLCFAPQSHHITQTGPPCTGCSPWTSRSTAREAGPGAGIWNGIWSVKHVHVQI